MDFLNIFYSIISLSIPLLLATCGGLISEYTGRMAVFLEGAVNLGAFLCFVFCVTTKNVYAGVFLAVFLSSVLFYFLAKLIEYFKLNPFIISLAINLLCTGAISFLSAQFFGTRGILTSSLFNFDSVKIREITTFAGIIIFALFVIFIFGTKTGLYFKICGKNEAFLESKKISTKALRNSSWALAAFFATLAGCVFSLRLNSFVPSISSGTGWIALAIVFLGNKNIFLSAAFVFLFSAAQFFASNLQNFSSFKEIPSSILLSLPYLISLFCIFLKKNYEKE